jgi:hypothetical protein
MTIYDYIVAGTLLLTALSMLILALMDDHR